VSLPVIQPGASAPSPAPPAAAEAGRETWLMTRTMVSIAVVCGALIVAAFVSTKPIIERNRAEALRRAIFEVLPQATTSATFRLGADGSFAPLTGKAEAGAELVHAGYDEGGNLVGLAIEAQGMGYQDTIRVIYGYTPSAEAITGFSVLESRETPGLGDKIGLDPVFLANFERLEVVFDQATAAILHPIAMAKHGEKHHPWEIDAITGATVSSRAVTDILRRSTALWVPRIVPRLDDFAGGSTTPTPPAADPAQAATAAPVAAGADAPPPSPPAPSSGAQP
jgi:electron transport complex protein RnfG